MSNSEFIYTTYIRTTPEKLWQALTNTEFIRQYWFGRTQASDWKAGATWKMLSPEGNVTDTGEILEIDPPKRLVIRWRHEFMPELKAEGHGQATYTLVAVGDMVKLTVVHEMPVPESKLIEKVSGGWPMILASLKSLIETGMPLEDARR